MLRQTPIHRVLSRPNLIMGCERIPLIICIGMSLTLGYSMQLGAVIAAVILWVCGLAVLRWAAKTDPHLLLKYWRSVKYRAYYPARATPFRSR